MLQSFTLIRNFKICESGAPEDLFMDTFNYFFENDFWDLVLAIFVLLGCVLGFFRPCSLGICLIMYTKHLLLVLD